MRQEALNKLLQVPSPEVQNNDAWVNIRQGLQVALSDSDKQLSVSIQVTQIKNLNLVKK